MIIGAAILFIIAAFFGSFILRAILKNKKTPTLFVFSHGVFAVFGLLVAIAYTIGHGTPLLITGVVILVLAALGGLTMLMFDINRKPIPKVIAIIHPMVAISGLIIVLIYIYQTFLI